MWEITDLLDDPHEAMSEHSSLFEAKAAVQTHHEAQVRAMIEGG